MSVNYSISCSVSSSSCALFTFVFRSKCSSYFMSQQSFIKHKSMSLSLFLEVSTSTAIGNAQLLAVSCHSASLCVYCGVVFMFSATQKSKSLSPGCIPVLQEVVFREDSEKGGLGVAQRSCFGVQGSCFLSSLSEGIELPQTLVSCSVVLLCVSAVCVCVQYMVDRG